MDKQNYLLNNKRMVMGLKNTERIENTIPFSKSLAINTPEWLRTFKGCEQHTDEEAMEIIYSLRTLAEILLKTTLPNKTYNIDNQLVVSLNGKTNENEHLKNAA
ncbi:MAG: hypothetical protein JST70_07975 [Bacteroidetes bacterium]|nr:hypothetical protein [Bacteroidota bacterium]